MYWSLPLGSGPFTIEHSAVTALNSLSEELSICETLVNFKMKCQALAIHEFLTHEHTCLYLNIRILSVVLTVSISIFKMWLNVI